MIRARLFLFVPLPLALWAILVLQEMRATVAGAAKLIAEIGVRFKSGDSALELIRRLETELATLFRLSAGKVHDLPDDLRTEIAQLLARVQATVAIGDDWLARTGPELATQHVRLRLKRAYGVR
ncbi:hypothetical protein FTUN_1897 [Frigoriglobus tundricola]|uniref:Uncharacterized protein n=2 Tax=Frigoriglobus tundricola TaxID=2774151 RepID=A0A6M5YK09_9BACT|nr:hypothetical protein FTUN_1897 [Frigoriglobus tundricola]